MFGEHKELLISFLTEIHENTKDAPAELAADSLVAKALELVEESGYTDAELLAIDKYRGQISRERTALNAAERKGEAKGRAEEKLTIASNLLSMGMSIEQVAQATGLAPEDIKPL